MICIANYYGFLDREKPEMLGWALGYLKRRFNLQPRFKSEDTYDFLKRFFEAFEGAELELLLKKMASAWRQKQYRDSQKARKSCTFMLSDQSQRSLEKLAAEIRSPLNYTLELIINDTYEKEKEKRKQDRANSAQALKTKRRTKKLTSMKKDSTHPAENN